LTRQVGTLGARINRAVQRGLESRMQAADMLGCRLVHPGKRIDGQLAHLQRLRERLAGSWMRRTESSCWRLRELSQRITMARPDVSLMTERQRELQLRLRRATSVRLDTLMVGLQRQRAHLAHLNPESVLERGYSIAYDADGSVLRSSDQIEVGDKIRVAFSKGWSRARVTERGS
jgi:exodeoxyribonuclease VII large subunit